MTAASSSGISTGERRNATSSTGNSNAGRDVARNKTVPLDGDNVSSSGAPEELLALCKAAKRSKIYK